MSLEGRIEDGRVVFDEPVSLPDGTQVRVEPLSLPPPVTPRVVPGTGDWAAVERAASALTVYDFDAWHEQRALGAARSEAGRQCRPVVRSFFGKLEVVGRQRNQWLHRYRNMCWIAFVATRHWVVVSWINRRPFWPLAICSHLVPQPWD